MTTFKDIDNRLNDIKLRRFKLWYNPEKLANQDSRKVVLYAKFPVYFLIRNKQQEVSATNHRDGHLDCAAVLSTYSAVLDRAHQNPSNEVLICELENFIKHVEQHNCTPIWGVMRDEAKYLLGLTREWRKENESKAIDA
jgi:hypothetical protein